MAKTIMLKSVVGGGQNGNTGGFAAEKVGKDGLTGRERAVIVGSIGGRNRLGYRKED